MHEALTLNAVAAPASVSDIFVPVLNVMEIGPFK